MGEVMRSRAPQLSRAERDEWREEYGCVESKTGGG